VAEIAFIKIENQDQYKRLARELRNAGRGDLQRQLVREIRRTGSPALQAVQRAFLKIDVQSTQGGGRKSTGLRSRVSAATRISVLGSGISIRVEPRRVDNRSPRYGRALTYGLDGLGRWRHPVYGNRLVWTEQTGYEVFYRSLKRYETAWRAGVVRAMQETARKIEG
jgi:hypothetical protein